MKTLVVFGLLCGVVTLAMPHIKFHSIAKRENGVEKQKGGHPNGEKGENRCKGLFSFAKDEIKQLDLSTQQNAETTLMAFGNVLDSYSPEATNVDSTKRVLQKLSSLKKNKLRSMLEALAGTSGKSRRRRSTNIHARGQGSNAANNQEEITDEEIGMCLLDVLSRAALKAVPGEQIVDTCFADETALDGLDWSNMENLSEDPGAAEFFQTIIDVAVQLPNIPQSAACVVFIVHYFIEMENQPHNDKCERIMTEKMEAQVGALVFDDAASLDYAPLAAAMDELRTQEKRAKTTRDQIRELLDEALGEKKNKKRSESVEDIADCVLDAVSTAAKEAVCPTPENLTYTDLDNYLDGLGGDESKFTFVSFFEAADKFMAQFTNKACAYLFMVHWVDSLGE